MRKLEMNQMEGLEGGINQRNCSVMGLVIVGCAIGSFFAPPVGLPCLAGAISGAAAMECF